MVSFQLTMSPSHTLSAVILFAAISGVAEVPILTTIEEATIVRDRPDTNGVPFDITAKLVVPTMKGQRIFVVGNGRMLQVFGANESIAHLCPTNTGDLLRLRGRCIGRYGLDCMDIAVVGHEQPDRAAPISGSEFYSEEPMRRIVSLRGTARSFLPDEIDPNYNFLTLRCDSETVIVAVSTEGADPDMLSQIQGSDIEVTGFISRGDPCNRNRMGRFLSVYHAEYIRFLDSPSADPFALPTLESIAFKRPSDLLTAGRHRCSGTVIATWSPSHVLLRTDSGGICRVDLARGDLPRNGMHVEASGLPETDFFNLNLSSAVWYPIAGAKFPDENPEAIDSVTFFTDERNRPKIKPQLHGRKVRVTGTVQNRNGNRSLIIDFDGHLLDLNTETSGIPDGIIPGTRAEFTGICVMDTANWRADSAFPRIRNLFIAIGSSADIRILAQPSWWTPARLLAVIGSLAILLLIIAIWNFLLHRLAAKRGRELSAESLAHAESDFKVLERTRLATELHDSIAQILTGVAFELEATDRLSATNPAAMHTHLGIAMRSLQACRDGLRNCLWDLRSHALELTDMNLAIRRTLEQHLDGADATIRFNIARECISDNTTHEILCIIRELSLNAIRHGHATRLWIAGAIEDDTLRFSVSDNGCGFDPENCPGIRQGHYGLQGVRERTANLDGVFTIDRRASGGMKAVVSIKIPKFQSAES